MPVHGLIPAVQDPKHLARLNQFEIVAPDGQPVRWALNYFYKTGLTDRVYGPELTWRLCKAAAEAGIRIDLVGSTPEVLDKLQKRLLDAVPKLQIAGAESPPFRPLTAEEDRASPSNASTPAAPACSSWEPALRGRRFSPLTTATRFPRRAALRRAPGSSISTPAPRKWPRRGCRSAAWNGSSASSRNRAGSGSRYLPTMNSRYVMLFARKALFPGRSRADGK